MMKESSITVLGKKYSGRWSEDFFFGALSILRTLTYQKPDPDEIIQFDSPYLRGAISEVQPEEAGIYSSGVGGDSIEGSSILTPKQLKRFVKKESDETFDPAALLHYLTNVNYTSIEKGGYERIISYSDMVTFEEIDFAVGMMEAERWYSKRGAAEVLVSFDTILDTISFYRLDLKPPS